MYRKQIGRSILFHLIIKRSAARQKEPQLSKEAAPQSFHPAKSPSIVIAVGIQIKIHILYRKQVDRHIIGLFHFFSQDKMLAQTFHTAVPLHSGLLGNDKVDRPVAQACLVAFQQVISHQPEVRTLLLLHVFSDDISLRVEGNSASHLRMGCKKASSKDSASSGCFACRSSFHIFTSGQCSCM